MLNRRGLLSARPGHRQSGVVLMVALIVLIAMTLAGIALVRSMDTSNLIAGNMAFQQAAIHAGDSGTEAAVTWLQANNSGTTLHNDIVAQGYKASRQDPGSGVTWDDFWNNSLIPAGQVVTLATDASGNAVSYTIQRLCNTLGDPVTPGVDCAVSLVAGATAGSSKGAGVIALQYNSQIYYRITSRIVGPHNTVSFIQAIVAM